jgi:hypothetical protein
MTAAQWTLDRLDQIAGYPTTIFGAPRLVSSPYGPAVEFGGQADSLLAPLNPLTGLGCFTVEVLFRPDADGLPEQRFLHMGTVDGDRALLETRLTADGCWFLDTYIRSGASDSTLLNQGFLHPVGRWYHLALTCDGRQHANYVDGQLERRCPVAYAPAQGGRTSIGVRLNHVCWFRGAIHQIRISPQALEPQGFCRPAGAPDGPQASARA